MNLDQSEVAQSKIAAPLTLEGSVVRLEPIRREHAQIFWETAKDALDDIFRWIPYAMKTPQDFSRLIEKAFAEQERGESVVFATVERSSGRVIGSTRFMNIDRINRRVEIGSTWIAPAWQRTAVNTEAKFLMLRHAFEVWQCLRVEQRQMPSTINRAMPSCAWAQKKKARCASTWSPQLAASATQSISASSIPNGRK
jgi:RimJ/RimL family protein N-acetyltransferase